MTAPLPLQSDEQQRYARWLGRSTRVGMVALVLGFAVYMLGLLPAQVPPEQLAALWSQPVAQYLRVTGAPLGWSALVRLHEADMLAMVGIVVLAGCSVPCLLALLPGLLRAGDRRFVVLCIAQAAVIVLAASGWLGAGHG